MVREKLVVCCLVLLLVACTTGPSKEHLLVQSAAAEPVFSGKTLKVMTLNIAHGRKDGLNQLLLADGVIHSNLQDIAAVLNRTGPDIVALQEADGPSRWSGNFDHVAELAEQTDFPAYLRSSHASGRLFSYGTALLSRKPFTDTLHHIFQASPPTLNKGFTLGQIAWQPNRDSKDSLFLDIVSVHLDFSRKKVREQQIAEIGEILSKRQNPLVILGDFNSDWFSEEPVVRRLVESGRLQVYQPEAKDLATYYTSGRRLDWILVSEELEFKSYRVLPDILSDHAAVVAEIGLSEPAGVIRY